MFLIFAIWLLQIAELENRLHLNDVAAHTERCQREEVINQLCSDKGQLHQSLNEKHAECLALQQQVVELQQNAAVLQKVSSLKRHLVMHHDVGACETFPALVPM